MPIFAKPFLFSGQVSLDWIWIQPFRSSGRNLVLEQILWVSDVFNNQGFISGWCRQFRVGFLSKIKLLSNSTSLYTCDWLFNYSTSSSFWTNDPYKSTLWLSKALGLLKSLQGLICSAFVQVIAWFVVIFGINTTSNISKLLHAILKYHKCYLCQWSRTNHAIICLYYPQEVCNFHM